MISLSVPEEHKDKGSESDSRIRQAMESWPYWMLPNGLSPKSPPRRRSALPGGRTNESFILTIDEYAVVLRLNSPESAILAIDREIESLVLKAVAQINLTPPIVFIDPKFEFLVTEYRPSNEEKQPLEGMQKQLVLSAVERLRTIALPLPLFDYVLHLQSYLNQLSKTGVKLDKLHQQRWNKFLPILVSLQNSAAPRSLCHHDLIIDNIIFAGEKVEFIDWEYAGIGFPELDRLQVDPGAKVNVVFHELAFWLEYLWVKQKEAHPVVV